MPSSWDSVTNNRAEKEDILCDWAAKNSSKYGLLTKECSANI